MTCSKIHTLVTHANTNGVWPNFLSGVRHGLMPPQLKTKKTHLLPFRDPFNQKKILMTLIFASSLFPEDIATPLKSNYLYFIDRPAR